MKVIPQLLAAFLIAIPVSAEVTDAEVEASVAKATAYLMKQQEPEWGFFKPSNDLGNWGKDRPENRYRPPHHSTALTSLSIMGLASVGHMPTDPTPEGRALKKALDYMLMEDIRDEKGYFGGPDNSQMYGHGITTLMFAEMIGMVEDEKTDQAIRKVLEQSVSLILAAQKIPKPKHEEGGWRYDYNANNSDLSITVWQLLALRAAKNAGIPVPKEAIDRAVSYVKGCYSGHGKDPNEEQGHKFSYESRKGGGSTSTTAAGVLSLQVAGQYGIPEVKAGVNHLLSEPPKPNESWFFYGLYYYSQGLYQRGGDDAERGKIITRDLLLPRQRDDGAWLAENGSESKVGTVYSTSLALLSLSVQHQFLPIYQR
jgi:hypothetical protein